MLNTVSLWNTFVVIWEDYKSFTKKLTLLASYFVFGAKYVSKMKYKTYEIICEFIFPNNHNHYTLFYQKLVHNFVRPIWRQNQKFWHDWLLFAQIIILETLTTLISLINYILCVRKLVWPLLFSIFAKFKVFRRKFV